MSSIENDQPSADQLLAARKAVRLVWDEVRRYGASLVTIEVSSTKIAYSFQARDGRKGEGSVNPRYSAAMSQALMQSLKMNLGLDSVEITGVGSGKFKLSLARRPAETDSSAQGSNILSLVKPISLAEPKKEPAASVKISTEIGVPGISVLVVEDNPTFSRVLVRFLERQGYTVHLCADGREAIEKLQSGLIPSLVISDLHMPHVSGDEFAVLMRRICALKKTPLMLLTSDRAIETELRALEAGADLFLAKSEDPRLIAGYAKRLLVRNGTLQEKASEQAVSQTGYSAGGESAA